MIGQQRAPRDGGAHGTGLRTSEHNAAIALLAGLARIERAFGQIEADAGTKLAHAGLDAVLVFPAGGAVEADALICQTRAILMMHARIVLG